MLGRYPYGIGNPPTLRRSSFPQRALRPAGDPIPTLGAVPQDPLTLKLRLDTNDVNIVRTAPQIRSQGACGAFYWGNCKPIAGSHAVETMGWISSYLSRRPLPRSGGGGRGCGAERRQWRMQRGGAPAAVEKIEQASSAKIFSGTARRWGQIRRGYLWSVSVRSTDLDFSFKKNLNSYPALQATERG